MNKLINSLLGRAAPAASEARAVVIRPRTEFVNQPALDAASKRKGMWVMTSAGIGILTGCHIDGLAEVTLAKDDGSTRMTLDGSDRAVPAVVICELADLRQAYIYEIPAARRGELDALRAMGYQDGGAA